MSPTLGKVARPESQNEATGEVCVSDPLLQKDFESGFRKDLGCARYRVSEEIPPKMLTTREGCGEDDQPAGFEQCVERACCRKRVRNVLENLVAHDEVKRRHACGCTAFEFGQICVQHSASRNPRYASLEYERP